MHQLRRVQRLLRPRPPPGFLGIVVDRLEVGVGEVPIAGSQLVPMFGGLALRLEDPAVDGPEAVVQRGVALRIEHADLLDALAAELLRARLRLRAVPGARDAGQHHRVEALRKGVRPRGGGRVGALADALAGVLPRSGRVEQTGEDADDQAHDREHHHHPWPRARPAILVHAGHATVDAAERSNLSGPAGVIDRAVPVAYGRNERIRTKVTESRRTG